MNRLHRRVSRGLIVAVAAASLTVILPQAARAGESCEKKPDDSVAAEDVAREATWAQRLLQMDRVWPLATGRGVTVAVLDSGVQADHPLLTGKVEPGRAYIDAESNDPDEQDTSDNGTQDCVGHGTAVAGIIAGSPSEDNEFYGLAPDATILPVRISNQLPVDKDEEDEDKDNEDILVKPSDFAAAIRYAVSEGADVINMSLKYSVNHSEIAAAVKDAVASGVVLVASAGNDGAESLAEATQEAYPAAYDGVIGVGAVNNKLTKTDDSQWGDWVDLVAPGLDLAAPQHDGKFQVGFGGTSGAAAFVSGAVALLAEMYPDWKPEHYITQLKGTASGVSGQIGSPEYGSGIVDPYRALTERLTADSPVPVTSIDPPELTEAQVKHDEDFAWMHTWSLIIALSAVAVFVVTLTGVAALRRGRRIGWRVARVSKSDMIEPVDDGDPIPLFQGIKGLKQ